MGNETVKRYRFKKLVLEIVGCWDKDTPEGKYDFYDLYLVECKTTFCLNEGDPFYELPSRKEVLSYYKNWKKSWKM